MATPYNILQSLERAKDGDRNFVPDPGAAGVIDPQFTDDGFAVLSVASSAYTLASADKFGLGTKLTVNAQAADITVDGNAVSDGDFATFIVTLDSSAAKQWVLAY